MGNHYAIGADPAFVLDKPDAVERPGPHAACEKIPSWRSGKIPRKAYEKLSRNATAEMELSSREGVNVASTTGGHRS
jgi:hypothetical protein